MAYDLLVKNGHVVDGSGMPSFHGDVGVKNGNIVAVGKLSGPAEKVVDADGLVVAPGFIDNHCHYDAQVTWDPLCTFSCYHGATTVIVGNCSLSLAPVRPGSEERVCEFLSYVEAIPMEALRTVDFSWETMPEYMDTVDKRLGVNIGTLIGHSMIRHYVMGDESQGREATAQEIDEMKGILREAIGSGALGLSITRHKGHFDPQGVLIPAAWATEEEIFSLCDVLRELGTGVIQGGAGRAAELDNRLMSRVAEATGRQVLYNQLKHEVRKPNEWKELIALVDESSQAGIRAYPMCSPLSNAHTFNMRNCQDFKGVPSWHPILLASDDEKLRAYADPEVRKKLHAEVIEWTDDLPAVEIPRDWYDYTWVDKTVLEKNRALEGKTLGELARDQGKSVIDAFLDLAVEENLDTTFRQGKNNVDKEAVKQILNYPNTSIGLSDGGAHVQFHSGYGFSTYFLSYWVREQNIMSLEQAVRRLTFEPASLFGIFDRGLLHPGRAADITIFDPDTIRPLPEDTVQDLPAGGWRMRALAEGIKYTIVNGQVLIQDGKHTGALPGRVMRNAYYQASNQIPNWESDRALSR